MSIQVNANAGAVNWDALLSKLGEVTKTEGAEGVAGTTNVTITTTVDGVETPMMCPIGTAGVGAPGVPEEKVYTTSTSIVAISTAVQRRSRKLECTSRSKRGGGCINTFLRLNSRYTAASSARNATPQ